MDLWIKSAHVISVIAWMAALLYLPRLMVYHVDAENGSELSERLKIMERRLLKAIMTPSMIATWVFGITLSIMYEAWSEPWFICKFLLVIILTFMHFAAAKWVKDFANDENKKSEKFYRIANEVPAVLMIFIVILVIVKPF